MSFIFQCESVLCATLTDVLINSLYKDNARPSDKDDLRSELATMRGMEPHPNILNFLGMCSETGEIQSMM